MEPPRMQILSCRQPCSWPNLIALSCIILLRCGDAVFALTPSSSPNLSFTYTGHAVGTLGGLPLNGAAFVIRATAQTGEVQPIGFGVTGNFVDHIHASISIEGFGQGVFLIPTRTWVNNSLHSVGLGRAGFGGLDLFAIPAPDPVGSWDLKSGFGPFAAPTLFINPPQFRDVATSLGLLTISQHATNGSFAAALIPEPISIVPLIEVSFLVSLFVRDFCKLSSRFRCPSIASRRL